MPILRFCVRQLKCFIYCVLALHFKCLLSQKVLSLGVTSLFLAASIIKKMSPQWETLNRKIGPRAGLEKNPSGSLPQGVRFQASYTLNKKPSKKWLNLLARKMRGLIAHRASWNSSFCQALKFKGRGEFVLKFIF